ncbi:hypothetical protein [Roseovarius sp. SYSU LYC5161]|uniref:hypothetical protein n=1 Tax=Roseovarius halophilus (ex Wu et al. 2025) TaxID=3376060 RepID=UPI00399BF664
MFRILLLMVATAVLLVESWVVYENLFAEVPRVCRRLERDSAITDPKIVWDTNIRYHDDLDEARCCLDIAHAGGAVKDLPYTNSWEAIRDSHASGRRVFELDFQQLADGSLVVAHDFDEFDRVPANRIAFLEAEQSAGLTRLDFQMLAEWLESRPGVVLTTDTKLPLTPEVLIEAFETRFASADIAERIGFHVYSLSELEKLGGMWPDYRFLLSLYRHDTVDENALIAALKKYKPAAVALSLDRFFSLMPQLRSHFPAMPIYTHGSPRKINSPRLHACLQFLGASGFYLD